MSLHHLLYRLLIIIFSPIILGQILWLSISNKESRYFWQRCGFGTSRLPQNCLWFHCASVGEVNTLMPLLKRLHEKNEQLKILITTNTITGGKIVKKKNLDYLFHCYLPFDWSYAVTRFLKQVKPASLHVMETEIWPNLFTICSQKNIPVYIINARLSKKTTSASQWIQSLLKYSLSKVSRIYTRSEDNTLAYQKLGANKNIISTVGNLKLTTATPAEQTSPESEISINRDYIIAASTHNDEELQIYKTWKQLGRKELLVIAPRHPERSAAIIRQLNNQSIAVRSKKQEVTELTEIFLLDTVGELTSLYADAGIVIMGGSFTSTGGHNILEPASYNRAIIAGPYMENFKQELELMLSEKAIIQVKSYSELQQEIARLLTDSNYRKKIEDNTKKLAHSAEEVLQEYAGLILSDYAS